MARRRRRAQQAEVIGFYKDEEKRTRPITKRKGRKRRRVVVKAREKPKRVSPDKWAGGRKATLIYRDEELEIQAAIRWETEKVEPLVKVEYRSPEGKLVERRYIGPKKRLAWVDEDGREWKPEDIQPFQVLPDGTRKPIKLFEPSKKITAEPKPKELMDEFMPAGYVEIWSDSTEGQAALRRLAWKLMRESRVAAVKKFVKAKGAKAYVGFIYPVLNEKGDFTLAMMIAENCRRRRRWMPAEPVEVGEPEEFEEAELPEVF
ncbi:MAG: hypothetical protein DRN49_06435 [Thaumarchaeota archaeon]|nr:MAG: hypothetical protein DRN49_06435 [Nitrososphaerota archaeon]